MKPTHTPSNMPAVVGVNPNPHFERLGGLPAVERLVEAFYRAMDSRPDAATIRAMHDADLSASRALLVSYLTQWLGGPKTYSAQRGTPMLRRRHQRFDIDASASAAWMACMRQALAECEVEAGLRAELDAAFHKIADFIRNTESHGAQRAHPGRPLGSGHANGQTVHPYRRV